MKSKLYLAFLLFIGLAACKKEIPLMSPAEMQYKIDSLTQVRIRESDEQARRDLQDRIKIEVKVKVDSIVNARLNPVKKDTLKPNTAGLPPRGVMPPGMLPPRLPQPAKAHPAPVH